MIRLHGSYFKIKISNKFNRHVTHLVRRVTPVRNKWKIKSTVKNLEAEMLERYCNHFNHRSHYFHAYAKQIHYQQLKHKLCDRKPYADLYFYTLDNHVIIPTVSFKQFRHQQSKQLHQDFNQVFNHYYNMLKKYVYTDKYFTQDNDDNKQIKQLRYAIKQENTRKDDNMSDNYNLDIIGYIIRFSNQFNYHAYQLVKHTYPKLSNKSINHLKYILERQTLIYYCKHYNQYNHKCASDAKLDSNYTISDIRLLKPNKVHDKKDISPDILIWLILPNFCVFMFDDFKKQLHQQLTHDFKHLLADHKKEDSNHD